MECDESPTIAHANLPMSTATTTSAPYVADLANVVDMEAIRSSGVRIGIDPLGGASVHFWQPIIEPYGIAATIVSDAIDPTFRFMTADWDGKIRMDCSSPYAMARLIGLRDKFDVAFANDTDADRHGIVTRSSGLMNPNHYLAVAIAYLFGNRPDWSSGCAVGKTIVSSGIIDRVTTKLGCKLVEVPVGFKWFVDGLIDSSLGFAGEESAGASFLRRDGSVWTTDKDGLIPGCLRLKSPREPGGLLKRIGCDREQAPEVVTKFMVLSAEAICRVMLLEATHTSDASFDPSMVLLKSIFQVDARPVADVATQCRANGAWVGIMPVGRHSVRHKPATDRAERKNLWAALMSRVALSIGSMRFPSRSIARYK